MAAMADLEKHRNGMDVVCRAERKCLSTFESSPQLNVNYMSACRLFIGTDSTDL